METKILEIRDRNTFIAVLAVNMNDREEPAAYYLQRYGYPNDGTPNIAITSLNADGDQFRNDPYSWAHRRSYGVAHAYILQHWATLQTGDVVDVEFILGETSAPKESERFSHAHIR